MIKELDTFIKLERHLTTVTLVVRLVDDYLPTAAPVGDITVALAGDPAQAVRNLSGFYVFNDVPAADYELSVDSELYLPETASVTVGDPKNLVSTIVLKPNDAYPFSSAATLVRGVVAGPDGKGVGDAAVQSTTLVPDTSVKAKLGNGGANAQDQEIPLVAVAGALAPGDFLMIRDPDEARVEFCKIAALPAGPGAKYRLAAPLKFGHAAATALLFLNVDQPLDTRTGSRGEFTVYFRSTKAPRFMTAIAISHAGFKTEEREVEVRERTLVSLGRIELTP